MKKKIISDLCTAFKMKLRPVWRYEDFAINLRRKKNHEHTFAILSILECFATSLGFRGHWFLSFINATEKKTEETKTRWNHERKLLNTNMFLYFAYSKQQTAYTQKYDCYSHFILYLSRPSFFSAIFFSFSLCRTLSLSLASLVRLKYNSFLQSASNRKR